MKIGLLGDDPDLVSWAERALSHGGQIVACCVSGTLRENLQPILPDALQVSHWKALSAIDGMTSLIVGGDSPEIAAAALELAASHSLLILPRPAQYATDIGLLDLQVTPELVHMPAFTARFHPAISEYLRRFQEGEMGDVSVLRLDRVIAPTGPDSSRIPHHLLPAAFLQDADLLRWLGGEFDRVTALRLNTRDEASQQTTVTFSGADSIEAVWSATAGPQPGWTLTLHGSRGSATIEQLGSSPVRLTVGSQVVVTNASTSADSKLETIDRCFACFLNRCRSGAAEPDDGLPILPRWIDARRAFALTSAVEESLRRQRTVSPRFSGNSERDQFKTQMTAIGCGVLSWTLVGLCVGLLLGQFLDPRDSVERRATAAGTVLWEEDFTEDRPDLRPASRQRLGERLEQERGEAIILIEPAAESFPSDLDLARVRSVDSLWSDLGLPGRAPQTEVRELAGRRFRTLMLVIWAVTFVPLALFLAAQGLILLTRPNR